MSSAVHSDRAKEQIACKVFIQCIKHTAAQSKLSVPLFFAFFVIEAAWKKEPGHSKQRQSRGSPSYLTRYFHRNLVQLHGRRPRKRVHTVEMIVPKPPKIFNDHRGCVPHTHALRSLDISGGLGPVISTVCTRFLGRRPWRWTRFLWKYLVR